MHRFLFIYPIPKSNVLSFEFRMRGPLKESTSCFPIRLSPLVLVLSYPNFVWGQLFVDMRIFASHVELLKANCHVIHKISWRFESKWAKTSEWGWKDQFRGCSLALGPSRPIRKLLREATSSLGRACYFRLKPPARLGEQDGKLLPYFDYKKVWEAEGRGSAPWESIFHLKLVKRRRKKKKIKVEALP